MSLTVHCTVIHLLLFFTDSWIATINQSSSSIRLLQTTSLLHQWDCQRPLVTYWAVTSPFDVLYDISTR